jgi:hypothetical protein
MNLRVGLPVLAGVLISAALVYRFTRPPSFRERVEPLVTHIAEYRTAVELCQNTLARNSRRLDSYDEQLDSLRLRVQALERMDPRGVPRDSYETYLESFDAYNAAVPGWAERADTVQAQYARCRAVTETHNRLADSLRSLMADRAREATRER